MRQAIDRAAIEVMRRLRRRRREREVAELTLPGLEGYVPAKPSTETHTAARRGATGSVVWSRSLRAALATAVVAGIPAAYMAGATTATAVASEEADRVVIEEASNEYTAAQVRESMALSAAVAAYSAEREAGGEVVPEDEAAEQLRDRGLTEAEVAEELEGIPGLLGKSHEEEAAIAMWEAAAPETEVTAESIREYEDASAEASEARIAWESAWDERQ